MCEEPHVNSHDYLQQTVRRVGRLADSVQAMRLSNLRPWSPRARRRRTDAITLYRRILPFLDSPRTRPHTTLLDMSYFTIMNRSIHVRRGRQLSSSPSKARARPAGRL